MWKNSICEYKYKVGNRLSMAVWRKRVVLRMLCMAFSAMLMSGCSESEPSIQPQADIPIKVGVSLTDDGTRATFLQDDNVTHYDINLSAYKEGTSGKSYFEDAWYTYTAGQWRSVSASAYETYVWPRNFALDFVSYIPRDLEHVQTGVSGVTYGGESPLLSFDCDLPMYECRDDTVSLSVKNQEDLTEFMYAIETGRDAAHDASSGVRLHYRHPFCKITLWLNKARRCTIDEIQIAGVYNKGQFTLSRADRMADGRGEWVPQGDKNNLMNIAVGKKVPEDINNNSRLAGPFIMMPQMLTADAKITVKYTPTPLPGQDGVQETGEARIVTEKNLTTKWEPGKEYIYVMTIGNADNEIVLSVQVVDWIYEGTTPVDVE